MNLHGRSIPWASQKATVLTKEAERVNNMETFTSTAAGPSRSKGKNTLDQTLHRLLAQVEISCLLVGTWRDGLLQKSPTSSSLIC